MLKKLSRWLRILGINAIYAGDYVSDDDAVIRLAMARGATLLTSDAILAAKARDYVPTRVVEPRSVAAQLSDVLCAYGLRIGRWPSRLVCPVCGSRLRRVGKQAAKRVPLRVLQRHKVFWRCINAGCGKIYWAGSHWRGIQATVTMLKRSLRNHARARRPH